MRRKRNSPFHSVRLRLIPAGPGGFKAPDTDFPGQPPASPAHGSVYLGTSLLLALLLHGSIIASLHWSSQWVVIPPTPEKIIPVELLKVKPAPAPRALAERRPITTPTPEVEPPPPVPRAPRTLNRTIRSAPTVTRAAAPSVSQPTLDELAPQALALRDVTEKQSPQQVQEITTQQVHVAGAVATVPSQATALVSDTTSTTGSPALRVSEGATVGSTQTTGGPTTVSGGTGADSGLPAAGPSTLLREGVITNRDVIGVDDANPLPFEDAYKELGVVLATGDTDAMGNGQVGGQEACLGHPEVRAYNDMIRERVKRELTGTVIEPQVIKFWIKLDTDGSIRDFELRSHRGTAIGLNLRTAIYEASPFPPMPEAVRCMAENAFVGKYLISPKE